MQKLVCTHNRPMNLLACILHYRKPAVDSTFQNTTDALKN